ncbi:hypothetical protein CRI93_13365 [Longimonas halophila]|uniref:Uncharacterized protein n=2 Tax=Longimonas halophila TaxID=1469170 RepID=A0A2H3P2B2_9BACT|nr:hypothetical protein CRI93_13365 [Longimonas halophila]
MFATAAAALLLMDPSLVHAQVEHTTSDITGAERVTSTNLQDTEVVSYAGTDIAYKAEYTYQPDTAAEVWQLKFYGFAPQQTGLAGAERVLVWINNQRHQIQDLESRTRRLDGEVLEIQSATLRPSVFQRMATAETVQVTIGAAEFDISYAHRADMREVVERARTIATAGASQQRADNSGR